MCDISACFLGVKSYEHEAHTFIHSFYAVFVYDLLVFLIFRLFFQHMQYFGQAF